jgi:flagellar motor switch protein FliG
MAPHDILLNETDRTVALVIAYIDTRLGAKILARFEPERQSKIIRHIIEFRPDDLPEELEYQKYIPFEKIGGVDFVGELLEVLDQAEWQVILEDISQNVPELANKTRQRILAFEDIAQFRDCNVQCLLKNIETMQWAVALQGTSEELKNRILQT